MFHSLKSRRKLFAIFSLFSFVFNIFQPAFLALSLAPVISPTLTHAEDLPPVDASPEPTTSPSESIVPSVEPTLHIESDSSREMSTSSYKVT